jgi:hypothetical protein
VYLGRVLPLGDWIETCDISEDDRSKIVYGIAKRLLKL